MFFDVKKWYISESENIENKMQSKMRFFSMRSTAL